MIVLIEGKDEWSGSGAKEGGLKPTKFSLKFLIGLTKMKGG